MCIDYGQILDFADYRSGTVQTQHIMLSFQIQLLSLSPPCHIIVLLVLIIVDPPETI